MKKTGRREHTVVAATMMLRRYCTRQHARMTQMPGVSIFRQLARVGDFIVSILYQEIAIMNQTKVTKLAKEMTRFCQQQVTEFRTSPTKQKILGIVLTVIITTEDARNKAGIWSGLDRLK